MEWLPEEMVEMIAEQLTAGELASCCAVSVSWRKVFGRDYLWRRHYDPALAPYLENAQPVVQPGFLSPETPNSTLPAISPSRLRWMREKHLQNNWSTGNFNVEELPQKVSLSSGIIFYKQDYVFTFPEHKILVWNVNQRPTIELVEFCFPLISDPNQSEVDGPKYLFNNSFPGIKVYVTENDKLIVEEDRRVGVFSLDLIENKFQLLHLFVLDEDKTCSIIHAETVKAALRSHQVSNCTVVGNVLVGAVTFDALHKVHVWDLDSGLKLKEVICPFDISCYRLSYLRITVPPSHEARDILIQYIFRNGQKYCRFYYVYSLTRLTFLPFHKELVSTDLNHIKFSKNCAIVDQYVAISEGETVDVFNYITSELMYRCAATSVRAFLNNILFTLNEQISTFHVCTKTVEGLMNNVQGYIKVTNQCIFLHYNDLPRDTFLQLVATQKVCKSKPTCHCFISVYKTSGIEVPNTNKKIVTRILCYDISGKLAVVNFW